jgi:translocation and assembly module TamB
LSPPSSSTPPPEKIKPLPPLSEFHVRLRRLDVRDSTVLLSVFDDTGNSIHRFTGINCQARVDMKLGRESDIFAAIDRLSVRSSLPEINITSLSGDIYYHMNENRFDFKNTAIRGEKCDFTINGSLAILENAPDRTMLDQIVMDLRADVPAMCLGEFGRAFPIDMPDTDIVSGDLAVKGPVSRMDCKVDLKMDKCHVVSQGLVSINDNYDVSLDLKGRIGGLDLAKLPALDLDFLPGDLNTDKFSLVWRDIGMPSQSGRISLHVTPSKLWEYAIDEAEITTEINDPDMSFKQLNIATPYGKMSGTLKLVGILSGSGDKRIEIDQDIKKLDLAELLKDNHYASAINGNVQTTIQIPESYDAEGITAEAVCRIETSKIMGVDIKGADAEAVWGEKMVTLKRLDVKTAFGSASVTGDVSIKDRTCRLKAGAELPDLGLIKPFLKKLPKDIRLSGDVSMTADVTGPWEEPDITATATGRDMAWNQITAGSLTTQGRWRGSIEDFSASADASLGNIQMGKVQANALNIAAALTPAAIHADIDLQGDREARLNLSGDIRQWMAPVKTIEITKMTLAAFDQPPLVNQGPLTANLSPDMITIDSLNLASGPATLNVKGKARLTPKGDVSAVMALRNMELSRLSGFLASGDKLRGQISSDIKLSGVMGNPVIRMDMSLEEAAFDKYSISEAVAFISYADSRAVLAASAGRNGAKLVDASGTASGSLSLLPFVFAPEPESLNLVLNIDDVDISWISELIDHPEYGVTGRLSANANLSGDFLNPRLEGRMDLAEGTLNLKKQGLTYDTLTADIEFSTDSITIKEVAIDGDKEGSLQLSGSLTHDRFVLRDFNIQAKGKDLFIPFRGGIQAWVNPDLTLSGDMLNPKIEGRIRVVKGRVNLDRLSDQQPSEIKIISADIPKNGVIEIPEEDLEPLSAFDPLTADIILDISKDCWLRGKDTQVEIKGNVQLKKDPRQPFVLFGGLNTVRGTYRFRGKLFQITQGELMFVGQEDLNPPVNIEARTEVDDVTILIRLTGTFQHLNLDFDSDPPMDQADIISYILFGRSPEALSDQETFKAEEMALSFTGQMAADKIKDVVGEALGIDYLNISTGSSGLRQGSLSMGKYLLPKVFVVFRQGFSDQNSQQFEVSYEINKYFDIQSQIDNEQTSALDLIWKYEF